MPNKKKLTAAILNITTEPPHSADRYRSLLTFLRDTENLISGKVSKRENLMLQYCGINGDIASGAFAVYTYIDPSVPWFDPATRKALVDEKGQPIPQVRSGIGPNLRPIDFMLFIKDHRLTFTTREIHPKSFAKGISNLFEHPLILEKFGPINVTIEPSHDIFQQIINIPHKSKIQISLSLPNSDVPSQMERDIYERFKRVGVSKVDQLYGGQKGRDIEPDEEMLATMKIGKSNGYVKVTGAGPDGKKVTLSTLDYPRTMSEFYQESDKWATFVKISRRLVDLVRGRREEG